MSRRLSSLALVAVLTGAALPARADDLATVRTRVQGAMASAKSFVVDTAMSGYSVTLTFAAPDRYHAIMTYGGGTRDVVLAGPIAYVSADGKVYRKIDAPPEVLAAGAQLRAVPVEQMLPDKVAGGKTFGQFSTTFAGPQKEQRLSCSYDKTTYRITDCANEGMTLAFSRYDDPANVVVIPTNLTAPAPGVRK